MQPFRYAIDWRGELRRRRLERGLSQAAVARRAGLSLSAVKAYERGDRRPSAQALDAMVQAIGLAHDEANPIRAGAGYAIDWQGVLERRYVSEPAEVRRQAEELPWPVFITNQGSYVVCWNRPFERLWDVDVEREFPDPLSRNLLGGAAIGRFARCIASYEETMAFFLGMIKGDPRIRADLGAPAPWHREAVQHLADGDPGELRRLLDAWEKARPIPHRTRHQYRVVWRYRGAGPTIRFIGVHTVCDIWNELSWQEWIPADAESWIALASLPEPGSGPSAADQHGRASHRR